VEYFWNALPLLRRTVRTTAADPASEAETR
jgi:hypothetical protein